MPTGKALLLTICFAAAALPHSSTIASPLPSPLHSINLDGSGANVTGLVNNAPTAKDISGIHLLLDNDVDSQTPKNPVILLSKPRAYKDGQSTCTLLGESTHGNTAWLQLGHVFFRRWRVAHTCFGRSLNYCRTRLMQYPRSTTIAQHNSSGCE